MGEVVSGETSCWISLDDGRKVNCKVGYKKLIDDYEILKLSNEKSEGERDRAQADVKE